MSLPTPQEFMALQGIDSGDPKKGVGGVSPKPGVPSIPGVSKEFRDLLVQYCAHSIESHGLEEMDWRGLAKRLGTRPEFLAEAAEAIDAHLAEHGGLWREVIESRIKRANTAKVFRDSSWENLEALAVAKLVDLATRNLIRDPGELLAIATAARRTNEGQGGGSGGGNHLNLTINNGADAMSDNGLPPAGAKMTIDLSPRVASALQTRAQQVAPHGERVIDGEMISAKDLRQELASRTEGEGE